MDNQYSMFEFEDMIENVKKDIAELLKEPGSIPDYMTASQLTMTIQELDKMKACKDPDVFSHIILRE